MKRSEFIQSIGIVGSIETSKCRESVTLDDISSVGSEQGLSSHTDSILLIYPFSIK